MPAKKKKAKAKAKGNKADPESLNRQLQAAILANDEQGVRAAVERGADVDGVMASGYYIENFAPLHHVAHRGNSSMVRVLVEDLGANVDVVEPRYCSTRRISESVKARS